MRRLLLVPLVLAGLAACGPKPPVADPPFAVPSGPLRAGVGVRLVELPVGHPTAGYAQSEALGDTHPEDDPGSPFALIFPATRGLESPPSARAVVLDNGHERLAIARVDAVFTTFELTSKVLELVKARYDVDLEGRLLLNATHTHAAGCRFSSKSLVAPLIASRPEGQRHAWAHGCDAFSSESLARVAGPVADAIGDALGALRPARLGWGFGENTTAARDRRCENDGLYGEGDHDTRVTVLRLDDAERGEPMAVLFHYAMHGTVNGADNRNLSVDAPGHAEIEVERAFDRPVVAMYLQGAAGDVSPAGDGRGHRDSQAMARAGWDLARTVLDTWAGIDPRAEAALHGVDRHVPLDGDLLGYGDGAFPWDGAVLCNFAYGSCPGAPEAKEDVLCAGEAVEGGGKYATWLAAASIDDLTLVTLPGEPTTEIGRRLRAAAREEGAGDVVVLGYAMDHDGYILTEEDWLSGGYESTMNLWGWGYGAYVLAQSRDLVHELLTGEAPAGPVTAPLEPASPPETPIVPTASDPAPALVADLPAALARLSEVRVRFHGGDPMLGHPEVIVERAGEDGAFAPVLEHGWRPVSSLVGGGPRLRYRPTPTFAEAPDAPARDHLWEAVWSPPRDAPLGPYRLRIRGRAWEGGEAKAYELVTAAAEVGPAVLEVEAAVRGGAEGPVLELTALYPALAPVRSELAGSTDWQIGGFDLVDPAFAPPFVPVLDGRAAGAPTVRTDGGAPEPLALAFHGDDGALPRTWAPGEGPGFSAPLPAGAAWEVHLPAGALADPWGNGVAAQDLTVASP